MTLLSRWSFDSVRAWSQRAFRECAAFGRGLVAAALDLVYPPPLRCGLCRGPASLSLEVALCTACLERLVPITSRCDLCGRAMARPRTRRGERVLCHQCRTAPPALDYARAYASYQGYMRALIHSLKYRGELWIAQGLGELLAWMVAVDPGFQGVQLIVPVPLHPQRERERGFNQAAAIAQVAGSLLGVPVVEAVVRTRETRPQTSLSWQERLQNLRGVFDVPSPQRVRGRSVLIVDDVYTTGATASGVALALKRAGSRRVCGAFAAASSLERDFLDAGARGV